MRICCMLKLLSTGWSLYRREIISGDEMKEVIVNAVFALRDVCGRRYLSQVRLSILWQHFWAKKIIV